MEDHLQGEAGGAGRASRDIAALFEVSGELNASLDLDRILDSLLGASLRLLRASLGYVVLVDKESGAHFLRAIHGAEFPPPGDRRSSVAEWVFEEQRSLVVNPAEWGRLEGDPVAHASSAVAVLLKSAGVPIGVLVVGDRAPNRRFDSDDVRLLGILANHAASAIANAEVFASLQEAYLDTVRSLAMAIDAKDSYTRGHSDRVATLASLVASRIGLPAEDQIALEFAAYLHDIGKIGLREDVLHKPGQLDAAEVAEVHKHPTIGASILEPVSFPWPIASIVRHHHERWDGTGYPAGLAGEQIPLLARILSVVDSHEAMISDRPYRTGMPETQAVDELKRCAGSQFDRRIVNVFVDALATQGAPEAGRREPARLS